MTQPPNWPPPGGFDRHIPLPPELPPAPPRERPGHDYAERPPRHDPSARPTRSPGQPSSGDQPNEEQSHAHRPQPPARQPYGHQQPDAPQHPDGRPHPDEPQQPDPPRKFGGGRLSPLAFIGAGVLAVALIAGAVTYVAVSGDDTGTGSAARGKDGDGYDGSAAERPPADPSAGNTLRLAAPKVAKRQVDSVKGSWLSGGTYAKAEVNRIVGHDADTGRKTWTLPLPGQSCAGTAGVSDDGYAAVVSEDGKRSADHKPRPCTRITVFDLNTGDEVWSKTVRQGTKDRRFEELSISGGTLAAGGAFDGGAAFDLRTGRILWQPDTGSCQDLGYRGGARLVAVRKCGGYGDEQYQVQLLDPTTGGPKWSYALATGPTTVQVLSTRPVVVGIGAGDNASGTIDEILTMDDRGKLTSKFAVDPEKYDLGCEAGKTEGCAKTTVGNGRVYLATRQRSATGSTGATGKTAKSGAGNEIVSYDLETGKRTGDRVAGGRYDIFPMRMDGGNVLAFKTGVYGEGSEVVTIDPRTRKQRTLLRTPDTEDVQDAITSMAPGQSTTELHYANGRLFLGAAVISAPYGKDDKRYTALGFSTG
ncbi:outer membrane protein assembly factor BamB family protein [Streptomyces sp. WG-D5]